jgi:UDP-N-acetyl-2-amino-2-deoxyglucuronate dehydrogenase
MSDHGLPILGRKIRFALVGCGRISRNHLAAIEQLEKDAELVAACDVDGAALAQVAARTGAKPFPSLSALLAGADPDVVVLATPSGLHPEQAIEAARAGKHVVTEKPMATRWEDGQRMVRECDAAGVKLFVVKQLRWNPVLRLLKRAVEKGRFGRIYMVVVNLFWHRPEAYYSGSPWRGTSDLDGGAFFNQASHHVDLLQWLFGPVQSVQAFAATLARPIEAEDTGVAALRWKSGTLGSINVTMLTYPKNFETSVTVIGERGTVRLGGAAAQIQHWEFAEPDPEDGALAELKGAAAATGDHLRYYENVIGVLRGAEEPETEGRDGMQSLELLTAIRRAALAGREISLPLES